MKTLSLSLLGLVLSLPAQATSICVAPGEEVRVPLPFGVPSASFFAYEVTTHETPRGLGWEVAVDIPAKAGSPREHWNYEVYIADHEGELRFETIHHNFDKEVVFKANEAGGRVWVAVIAKNRKMPVAMTPQIEIEVRPDRNCN